MYYIIQFQTSRNFVFAVLSRYEPRLDSNITHASKSGTIYKITPAYTHKHALSIYLEAKRQCDELNNKLSIKLKQLGMNHHVC